MQVMGGEETQVEHSRRISRFFTPFTLSSHILAKNLRHAVSLLESAMF